MAVYREPSDDRFLGPLLERGQWELAMTAFHAAEAAGRALGYDAAITETRA
jgi:hypothetical protein